MLKYLEKEIFHMKRFLALALSAAMILSVCLFAGCGNTPDETTGSSTPKETTAATTTEKGGATETTAATSTADTTTANTTH